MHVWKISGDRIGSFIQYKMAEVKPETISLIKEFSGTSSDFTVTDFIEQIEDFKKISTWTDEQAYRVARRRLTGVAAELVRTDDSVNTTCTWTALKKFLIGRFGEIISKQDARFAFMALKQKESESVDEYALRIDLAAKKAFLVSKDPSEKATLAKINANDKLLVFTNGLRFDIWQYVYSKSPTSFADALELARQYEISVKQRIGLDRVNETIAAVETPSTSNGDSGISDKLDGLLGAVALIAQGQQALNERLARMTETEAVCAINYSRKKSPSRVKIREITDEEEDNNPGLELVPANKTRAPRNYRQDDYFDPIQQLGQMFMKALIGSNRFGSSRPIQCHYCKKYGHIKRNCWKKDKSGKGGKGKSDDGKKKKKRSPGNKDEEDDDRENLND